MKRILSALALSAVLASPAWSAQMRGMSFTKCEFLNNYHTTGTSDWAAVKQWIYGYMSGVNAIAEVYESPDFFTQIHFDAAYGFVRRYCETNPEKTIMIGVVAFTQEITGSTN